MKVAICDEEKESSELLYQLIRQQEPDCEVICFDSSRRFLELGQHFDILLLDIQMEKMQGVKVARAIQRENTILIFVTALKEYILETFDISAFYYLSKPVSREKFYSVFKDACELHRKSHFNRRFGDICKEAGNFSGLPGDVCRESDHQHTLPGTLFFRTKTRSFTLQKRDILYVESRRRKVDIHTPREVYVVYATMKYMEEQLGQDFYRCHRGYLVNMAYVSEYGEGIIRLQNGESVYVAREKYREFVKAYTQYRDIGYVKTEKQ